MKLPRAILFALGCLFASVVAHADVTLPKILGDNMVLQRERPVAIWGTASANEKITVSFAGQEKKTAADAAGHWQVALDPLKASATPGNLTCTGNNTVTLKNILVGEVWFCGGQSNMEYSVNASSSSAPAALPTDPKLAEELKTETYPTIRLFRVEKQTKIPQIVTDGWTDCSGDALNKFSAIGFFFARNLQHELNVPIGIVGSYWGGSRLEQWIPAEAFAAHPAFAKETAASPVLIDGRKPGDYYNSMIRDLAPFTLRGMLWYQGESNIIASNDGVRYADKMQALVNFWRGLWQDKDLPIYQVQLAPFLYTSRKADYLADKSALVVHGPDELPKLWEAQLLATRIPHVMLVPTEDLDSHFNNIHPSGKRTVAQRLTDLALVDTYKGKNIPYAGPLFDKLTISGASAIVHFNNADGLAARDGKELTNFEIAGADGKFFPAQAAIKGETVTLSSPQVTAPVSARLGWTETAQPNLVNKDGLPAYPFRSDGPDWKPAP